MSKIGLSLTKMTAREFIEKEGKNSSNFLFGDEVFDVATFYESARKNLPMDPPLLDGSLNWDAFSDSLWGGVFNLNVDSVVIFWRSHLKMKKNDMDNYLIACDVFDFVSKTLSTPQYCRGRSIHLSILISDAD